VWRNRGGVLVSAVVVGALGVYLVVASSLGLGAAGSPATPRLDCADTAMLAMTSPAPGVAQRAYQCMGSSVQARLSEAEFVRQMETQRPPTIDNLARIGDHRAPTGGTMVYYALDGGGESIGYIVYLDSEGKVLRIE
jgi:hypothetical protein